MDGECPQPRIPVATYRLQFNRDFTFAQAREIVAYLHGLGITDLYASSYFAAKEGSLHGYDIVNQSLFNREIGDEQSYGELVRELKRHGMGQILDFVPNHMCIESTENLWWMDVLENGPSSPYARFFDIDWHPVKKELTNKVLLPFLGDQYGKVLEKGELGLSFAHGAFWITFYQMRFPLEPKSYLLVLEHGLERLRERLPEDAPPLLELLSIITSLQHLPPVTEQDHDRKNERHREKDIIKKRLGQLCDESSEIGAYLQENITAMNGCRGESHSFDSLDRLLREQVYRLSYWRVATEEINYRRFFDINGLAAIRMEDPSVFQNTHRLLCRLIRERSVTGIRIDHVDGLYDPLSYLCQLQGSMMECLAQSCDTGSCEQDLDPVELGAPERLSSGLPLYLICEKILMKGEHLPENWPVHGSTGYEFLNNLNGLFVMTENSRYFDRIYNRFVGRTADFSEVVYESKKLVMEVALSGEVNMLANRLNALSERDRQTRDFTLNNLRRAIIEVIAFFPVYRTYVNSWPIGEKDSQYIEAAVNRARRKNPAISASVFEFLRSVLLLRLPDGDATEQVRGEWLHFAMAFQQITGPVMAKGLEDTSFYLFNRLISLNEVGGAPGRFGTSPEAFHGQNLERLKSFPHGLSATATHDTKRGEDARLRIDVLSEVPALWHTALMKWSRINKHRGRLLENQAVPDHNEEYLLYQTLVGAWPMDTMSEEEYGVFRGRIRDYIIKAAREAKVNTSWVSPNLTHEEALNQFVDALLDNTPDNAFLREFIPFQKMIARYGIYNSLSQTVLKIASPGVPDFYQGSELWDFSLVDPDNRRPVNYTLRRELMEQLRLRESQIGTAPLVGELLEQAEDGRIKMFLTARCLGFRSTSPFLFQQGDYQALEIRGPHARHVVAFARRHGDRCAVAVASRFFASLVPEPGLAPTGEQIWQDDALLLPNGGSLTCRNVITDEVLACGEYDGKSALGLAQLFRWAPVALLECQPNHGMSQQPL